jgi:geranylgeranyl pyrophosphate synthase
MSGGNLMLDPAQSLIISDLSFEREMRTLREEIGRWVENCDAEIREALRWQFITGSKYFRPLTVFSCYRAVSYEKIPPSIIRSALLIELFHNVSLVIDDIVDRSDYRRNRLTLHGKFGELPALMTAGYIVADGYRLAGDCETIALLSDLFKRLAVAECLQWRLRRQPLGVEDWRKIAAEDTGSMFETAACLGDRSGRLRKFGGCVGLLYHGCDDVGDMRGTIGLGGGGNDDLRDGILTLPAALAIRDPEIARRFCNPQESDLEALAHAFQAKLPEAEAYLDGIAEDARAEARLFAVDPQPLLTLVDHTRQLSQR